ncbi:unnamed protein product [Leptidea sinapis]|uniref:Putative zinc-finger domain-containing protein n=1 Tax=Leptidea sinapis TaxID=189913 RepID=A0A5E4QLG0_9NEOP|nr:unnamed protein product [Leptidea sinapis]
MACLEMQPENPESEREEGEIVDDIVDQLSDISSEEEYLMLQRLTMLENYNDVLERKKAKTSSIRTGNSTYISPRLPPMKKGSTKPQIVNNPKNEKFKSGNIRKKEQSSKFVNRPRNTRRKQVRGKKPDVKIVSESSEDSADDEYKNKRRRLADAVTFKKSNKSDACLKDRIAKMLRSSKFNQQESYIIRNSLVIVGCTPEKEISHDNKTDGLCNSKTEDINVNFGNTTQVVSQNQPDISIDNNARISTSLGSCDTVDSIDNETKNAIHIVSSSDDDLESLRQHALKTKSGKQNMPTSNEPSVIDNKVGSDDEDSDTAELRLICLRSSLLKRAMELKKKQKLQKRLSQSSIVQDEDKYKELDADNNNDSHTDVENVDMDIGSDMDEKPQLCVNDHNCNPNDTNIPEYKENKQDEIEEDEDLLRARLLTSLSKNLPNLIDLNPLQNVVDHDIDNSKIEPKKSIKLPEEKKFIIQLGNSDSETENEATRNLTKMHMKLAEQTEFQQKLDLFLKSTRMQVEKNTVPDTGQLQTLTKPIQKFVPKKMQHLPTSEQMEYNRLVKRMAELEKIKQARLLSKKVPDKDTLKPRNVSISSTEMINNKLEGKIASSRKMIAEESAKMLKLKEEAKKLSQRYKIVSTELKNITTAITLNKKQQRFVQNSLSKIRLQHQMLLKSSSNYKHNNTTTSLNATALRKLQKENHPSIKDHNNPSLLKTVKVSFVNNLNTNIIHTKQNLANYEKSVNLIKADNERVINIQETERKNVSNSEKNCTEVIKEEGENKECDIEKYISPLDAIQRTDWKEDPNAFLCPYEAGGSCRDSDCRFLHLNTLT